MLACAIFHATVSEIARYPTLPLRTASSSARITSSTGVRCSQMCTYRTSTHPIPIRFRLASSDRIRFARPFPPAFGFPFSVHPEYLVAITARLRCCARNSPSQRSEVPPVYTSAVSKKLPPRSRYFSTIRLGPPPCQSSPPAPPPRGRGHPPAGRVVGAEAPLGPEVHPAVAQRRHPQPGAPQQPVLVQRRQRPGAGRGRGGAHRGRPVRWPRSGSLCGGAAPASAFWRFASGDSGKGGG